MKKLKDKAFAAKVERHEIQKGVELLGVDLTEHMQFIIEALKPHADELGISKGQVSKLSKKLRDEGRLGPGPDLKLP